MIDLQKIDEELAKAKMDVEFWEKARILFLDPRISHAAPEKAPLPPAIPLNAVAARPYGELKRKVYEHLPEFGGTGLTTSEIAAAMQRSGYSFTSRTPAIAVNEALVSLGEYALVAGKHKLAKLWTKGEKKKPAEAGF